MRQKLNLALVPMEEIVRAFNYVIEKGWAFYWGTSEWSAQEIEEAHRTPVPFSNTGLDLISHRHCDETQPDCARR
jgi:aryl-alcohol dehydrogenase-like predicted oxidoreductase